MLDNFLKNLMKSNIYNIKIVKIKKIESQHKS